MRIGEPRQRTMICWPSAILLRSISIGAPAAITSAAGFMVSIIGHAKAAAPMAAVAPVTSFRKSRRGAIGPPFMVSVVMGPFEYCRGLSAACAEDVLSAGRTQYRSGPV